jgi:hypothetical protein
MDRANATLREVDQSVRAVDEKLNMILLFRRLESPHEKELMKAIDAKGGVDACLEDDAALKDLMSIYNKQSGSPGNQGNLSGATSFVELRKELTEDFEQSLEKNLVVFERKLELQKRQIVIDLELVVQREGDRVISAVTSGPHDRILDPVSFPMLLFFPFYDLL